MCMEMRLSANLQQLYVLLILFYFWQVVIPCLYKMCFLIVILGTETSNKYEIKNSLGQRIYFAVEESICFNRNVCSTLRACTLRITDNSGREVITVNRPLRCNSCWCPCYLQEVGHCLWASFLFKIIPLSGIHLELWESQPNGCLNLYLPFQDKENMKIWLGTFSICNP